MGGLSLAGPHIARVLLVAVGLEVGRGNVLAASEIVVRRPTIVAVLRIRCVLTRSRASILRRAQASICARSPVSSEWRNNPTLLNSWWMGTSACSGLWGVASSCSTVASTAGSTEQLRGGAASSARSLPCSQQDTTLLLLHLRQYGCLRSLSRVARNVCDA